MGSKALEESSIPDSVKAHLSTWLRGIQDARLLLIRQGRNGSQNRLNFFVAKTRDQAPLIYQYRLNGYNDLLGFDIDDLVVDNPDESAHHYWRPLYVICTNGRRDPCCAKWGVSLYRRLYEVIGEDLWQSSHVGGHRFAANMVCFPYGIYFGRLRPDEALPFIVGLQNGQIDLNHYRGRSYYPPPAQAGEYFLRKETGETYISAFRLINCNEMTPGRWKIGFLSVAENLEYALEIITETSSRSIFESCSSVDTTTFLTYRLDRMNTHLAFQRSRP